VTPDVYGSPRGRLRATLRMGAAVSALLAIAIALTGAFGTAAQAQDQGQQPALVDRGAEVFGARCATCHGEAGRGTDDGPSLAQVGPASFDFVLRTGRMPIEDPDDPIRHQEPKLPQQDIQAIVEFSRTITEGPDIPEVGNFEEADLARGLELFTSNCAACHGPTAAGIAVGQRDVSSNLDVATPEEIAAAIRVGPGVMPLFPEEVLPQEDMEAVVHWVMDLRERESPGGINLGRSGPVWEGLVAWVVGLGLLAVIMYLLGERAGASHEPTTTPATTDGEQTDGDT
jgi:ubiquinol-cytochrome c reductase cytochrome c subunit